MCFQMPSLSAMASRKRRTLPDDSDKRNKLICLTESGMEYTKDIIEKLHSKEIYVIDKMGLENIESLNDNTELFIRLFKED